MVLPKKKTNNLWSPNWKKGIETSNDNETPHKGPVLIALSKSAIRSSASSMPTEIRIRSSVKPLDSRTAAGMAAWDMKQGKLMSDFTLPSNGKIAKVRIGQRHS